MWMTNWERRGVKEGYKVRVVTSERMINKEKDVWETNTERVHIN